MIGFLKNCPSSWEIWKKVTKKWLNGLREFSLPSRAIKWLWTQSTVGVTVMVRIRTVTHGEYEVLNAIMDSLTVAETLQTLKYQMVPENDEVAEKRFNQSVASIGQYLSNMAERRLHRLPKNHPDYREKGD